jgi:hypothetical protein
MLASVPLTTRNAELTDLTRLLRRQQLHKVDVAVDAAQIRFLDTRLLLQGTPPVISEDGVTSSTGLYMPTAVCDEGIADKLGIPLPYLRRLRTQRPDLYDANVNGWLERDDRRFLIRCLRGDDGGLGVARAFLSDRYKIMDNLDVLMATLAGVREAGVNVQVDGCDLSERRMYVRIVCEQVSALAPDLLAGYRSPFTGAVGADNPVVFAGLVISNSETGCGAWSITPRLVVQICRNGLAMERDVVRSVHLGSRLEEGLVRWSADTQDKNLALVTSQTSDAVRTFLDVDYVRAKIRELTSTAGTPIGHPQQAIELVSNKLRFSDEQQATILAHFIKGGALTAGGVLHAITSTAQTLSDADAAHEMETSAVRGMQLAASAA